MSLSVPVPCRQHYIPHRKSDWVNGQQIPRDHRRVSLTLRKVSAAGVQGIIGTSRMRTIGPVATCTTTMGMWLV